MRVHCKVFSVVIGCLVACGGSPPGGSDPDLPGRTASPEGVPYPTENWGGGPGKIFPNLTFSGVLSADSADTPAMVSMADYFDPEGLRYDLLHIVFMALNLGQCDSQATKMAKLATWHAERRIATMEIATFGVAENTWPTIQEVAAWARDHNLASPVLIDATARRLRKYWDIRYLPVQLLVNPRTMMILDFKIGGVLDMQSYQQSFLPPAATEY